jgi:formylglycine-generating enzyme required for sulfatase activity
MRGKHGSRFTFYVLLFTFFVLLLTACGIEVPGGIDDFRAATPTQSEPTVTPVIIAAPDLLDTPTSVPPPPTPVPQPSPVPQDTPVAGTTPSAGTPPVVVTTPSVVSGEMIKIPAGAFTMGANKGDDDEKPEHQVNLPEFQIDKYEVTNALFEAFATATGYKTEAEKRSESRSWRTYFAPDKANHPVVKVTWSDAQAYCEWTGKRLPTEAEWEKAARGADGRLYPWGNEYDPGKFNGKASGIRGTTSVGSYPAGVSAFRVFDMAGNVWEWTADWYKAYPGNAVKSQFYGEKFRVTRGGGWFDEQAQARASNRSSADPMARNDDLGFRCAK